MTTIATAFGTIEVQGDHGENIAVFVTINEDQLSLIDHLTDVLSVTVELPETDTAFAAFVVAPRGDAQINTCSDAPLFLLAFEVSWDATYQVPYRHVEALKAVRKRLREESCVA